MKNLLSKIKQMIKKKLKKIIGVDELNQRIARLEEITTNMDIGLQVDNGLRYLEHIRSTTIKSDKDK